MKAIPSAQVHATLAKHYPPHVLGWVKRATWHAHPGVPLSRIDMARRPGARNPEKVAAIADAVKAGKPMPPVMLVNTGDAKLQIADGYHRTLGFEHAGKSKIPALIASGVGAHGPWEKRMHAAKLNLTAAHVHVLDLAGVCTGPGPCDTTPLGSGKNWLQKVNGLPVYIRAIAHSLRRGGMDESRAISTAIATVKRWSAGGGNVTPATRARAAKAVAEWEAKKAASHSLTAAPTATVDLAATVMSTTDMPTVTVPAGMKAAKNETLLPDEAAVRRAVKSLPGLPTPLRMHLSKRIKKRARELGMTVDLTADATTTLDLTFTEDLHPRGKTGTPQGGRFVAKGSDGGDVGPAKDTRDFQRRTGLKRTGKYDTATAAKVNALLNPKSGGGHGKGKGKGKSGKAATPAQKRASAARTASAVNGLNAAQRELYRAKQPTPPPGYRWTGDSRLVAVGASPEARAVRRLLRKP